MLFPFWSIGVLRKSESEKITKSPFSPVFAKGENKSTGYSCHRSRPNEDMKIQGSRSFLLLLWMVTLDYGTQAIKITNFVVPETMEGGKESKLVCEWQTENDQLYSLKWYVGLHEFYRYTPAGVTPKQAFDSDAFTVDLRRSGKGHVTIQNVTVMASGVYRCEVSAEAPSFQTDSKVGRVEILVIPRGKPYIEGVRELYHMGDVASLNCFSPKARPKPTLVFYVNNELVNKSQLQPSETLTDKDGLQQSSLILRIPIRAPILQNTGVIRVRCEYSTPRRYNEATDVVLRVSLPLHASVREGRTSRGYRIVDSKPCMVVAHLFLVALVPLMLVT